MQNILIVEDDSRQLQTLRDAIAHKYTNWKISTAQNYSDAKEKIHNSITLRQFFTLFLLDVRLSEETDDRSGFALAQMIREHKNYYCTPLLFLTALSEERGFALSEFHCYDYICKPYKIDSIIYQIEQMLFTGYIENTIEITDTCRTLHRISINEILMIKSHSHTLIIHTTTNQYLTRNYTLKQILPLLGDSFLQCHKCHIINKHQIIDYDKVTNSLQVGSLVVPVGRSYYSDLKTFFSK